jgi:hypothetical protein
MTIQQNTDFTLISEDSVPFNVHEYFSKILSHDSFTENLDGVVKLTYFNSNIVKDLIELIYSGAVDINEENMIKLFEAANMYRIKLLPELCTTLLERSINQENVVEIIVLVFQHDFEQLFNNCATTFKP